MGPEAPFFTHPGAPIPREQIVFSVNGDGKIPHHGPVVICGSIGSRLRDQQREKKIETLYQKLIIGFSFLTSPHCPTKGEEPRRQLKELTRIISRLADINIGASVTFPAEVEILSPEGLTFNQSRSTPHGESEKYTLWVNNHQSDRIFYFRYQEREITFPSAPNS